MLYIENIILYCLKKLNGERTIYSIYHLLKGKKSSQTIQDAHLFDLIKFFKIYEPLTRKMLEEVITKALEKNWITFVAPQRYLLTETGAELLDRNQGKITLHYMNGWKYHSISQQFWERLSLLIQVVSNLVFQETHYLPIQKNKQVHIWLKSFIKNTPIDRNLLGKTLFLELEDCLQSADDIDPSVLVFRLTGYNCIGETSLQVAERLGMENFQYHLEFQNVLHYCVKKVETDKKRYPILSNLLIDLKEKNTLTNSTKITFDLVQKGYSIDEIVLKRRLKKSTIEDHIVEIALNIEQFSIDPFIEKGIQDKILSFVQTAATRQLKLIKSKVVSANYFEIRLVLAKYGVDQWN